MVSLDSESLFNGAAAALSAVALLVFLFSVDLGQSPVSEIVIAVGFLVGVFALTQRSADQQVIVLGYGVIVVGAVATVVSIVGTFNVGNAGTVLGMLAIAAGLVALRARVDADNHFTTGRTATYAFVVVAVLAVAVVGVDVATGGLEYELQSADDVEVTDAPGEQARVAMLAVTNPGPFPERVEPPQIDACAAGNWSTFEPPSEPDGTQRPVSLHASVRHGYDDYVFGFGDKRYPVELNVNGHEVAGERFPVERTSSCPDDETGDPYVALFEDPVEQRPYAL